MSLKAYNIDVPITPGVMPPVIHIGQYDSGREYIAHLKNDDGTDYTIPANSTATFTGCNPRKEVFEIECNITNNAVIFVPQDEATSMWGLYGATINITSGGEKMSPIVIKMDVQKAGATDEEIAGAANFPDAVTEAVNDWLEDNIEEGQLGTLFVPQAPQAAKTSEMTQPVGMDETGKLWTTPGGGSGAVTPASIVTATSQMTTAQKTSTRNNINAAPSTNIQKSALASAVQTSLGKADTAYQKPSGGIPASDMASAVQTALTAAGTAVQPTDLSAYIPRAAQGAKTVNDTQPVRVAPDGSLWTQPGGDGGGSTPTVIENTKLITTTYYDGDTYASMTAAQIYDEIENGPVNLVLIDRAGRQCALIAPPEESGGSYTAARFFTLDDSGVELIIYSVSSTGTVSSTTIPIPEDSGGGTTSNAVLYVAQSLTTAQKTQARTNIGAGTGSYSKPSSGIPKTDLASAVQTSLNNADSAYQKPLTGISEADLATESVVISPDTEHAGQYVSTRTYSQIEQASSDGFAIKPEFWPDNNTTIRGAVLDISSTASVFAFLDTRAPTKIYVFTVNAQGVSANISTPLNADSLTAKTSAMTQPVGYRASDGTLWTAPGSGGGSAAIETVTMTMTVGQSSKVLSVNLGYSEMVAKIAAGARFVSQMTVGQDIVRIEWEVTGGNATQQSIILRAVLEDANGQNLLSVYMLENQTGVMSGDVESQLIGNAKTPKRTTKSGTSPAAFALYDNEIYTCGTVTSLTITSALSGADSILIFTSGSTPTNLSLPSNLVFADGSPDVINGVLIPSANFLYEINVSNRRALVSRWAVS